MWKRPLLKGTYNRPRISDPNTILVDGLIHQVVSNPSFVQSTKPFKFLNYKPMYLFFGSHYKVYKSKQHILRTHPHKVTNKTNTTLSKFDKLMGYLQHGHHAFETHDNFNIIQTFQSFFCKWDNTWKSLFSYS
jgi:hypothetical protein